MQNFFFCRTLDQLEKNFDEFNLSIDGLAFKPSIICLTETWLADDGYTDCYQLPGYQKKTTCKIKTKGGYVSISVKNIIRWVLISKFSNSLFQALTDLVKLNYINVLVKTIYVKPNISTKNFSENIHDLLDNIQLRPKDSILIIANPITEKKILENELEAFDLFVCKQSATPRKLQKFCFAYCSHVVEQSIPKTTLSDHYIFLYDLKMDNKHDREV